MVCGGSHRKVYLEIFETSYSSLEVLHLSLSSPVSFQGYYFQSKTFIDGSSNVFPSIQLEDVSKGWVVPLPDSVGKTLPA